MTILTQGAEERYGPELARAVVGDADSVLADLEQRARRRAEDFVTSVFLQAEAAALAEMLAGRPLVDAEEAHAPLQKAVDDAEKAVSEAREAWKAQMMEWMRDPRTEDGIQKSQPDNTSVDRAWQVLREAQSRAEETGRHLRSMYEKIERLRAVPKPDPDDISILARLING